MTTTPNKSDLPVYDFSTTPEQRAEEQAKIDAAIASAKASAEKMYQDAGKVLNNPKKQDAPAAQKFKDALVKETQVAKAKGLVPTKKAATKKSGKAGRIVGISKDENEYIQEVLHMIADDPELGASNPNYVKIQARYNK